MNDRQLEYRHMLATFGLASAQPKAVRRSTHNGRIKTRGARGLAAWLFATALFVLSGMTWASVTGSISGTVKDPSGAAIAGATVTATNIETSVVRVLHSNEQGYYSFQSMALGHYNIDVDQSGFRPFRQTGLVLEVNAALVVDVTMQMGEVKEAVTVTTDELRVETASTQLGEVIQEKQITSVPLNGRSYTDLLSLQPGVGNANSGIGGGSSNQNTFQSGGFQLPSVSGDQNAGNLSVNGMRESANGYLLNGISVQEFGFSGTAVVPNLESLAEFRIITNNFDAEYGNFAGGQINVVTKAGANQFHGNVFEFLRNTSFDAANYFDQGRRGAFHQNQFGGTFGGPIKKDKIFFFGDYQENRKIVGVSTGTIAVPTAAERDTAGTGFYDFSALPTFTGTVQGNAWAAVLSNRLNTTVTSGEPYSSVFPGNKIPAAALPPISKNVLAAGAIPLGDGNGSFSTSANALNLTDRKGSGRVDANIGRLGTLFGYYYIDQFSLNNPYPVATVPGFSATTTGRSQVINIGNTKTIGNSAVNEARVGYLRVNDLLNKPSGGTSTTLSQLGFSTDPTQGGILPLNPNAQGIPEMDFQSFNIGVPSRVLGLVENTYQASDNYSKLIGTHSLKFGGAFHYTQMAELLHNIENGYFFFNTTSETGVDFADFLLGAPGTFQQGQTPAANTRSYYIGAFAQDSWRARRNLTLNYGVRWDVISPWWEKHDEIETLKLGLQSKKFSNSPVGWVFPGDPGIPRTIAPVRWGNFAPRLGLAYSPEFSNGFLGKLFGGPGQTSIRLGYGMFYSAFEGGYDFSIIGDAPYGAFYSSGPPPSFNTPYINRGTGTANTNPFPANFNPPSNIPASAFGTIGTAPAFNPSNRVPYAEQYELSIQRQITPSNLLTLSYVGTQAHRLLVTQEANPIIPALCAADPTCNPHNLPSYDRGPFSSHNPNDIANGLNQFGSEGYFSAIGNSSYNSLQLNFRHTSGRLQLLMGYTYSKSLDDSSAFGEQVNPFDIRLSRGLSSYNIPHNFVVSYSYYLPFDKLGGPEQLVQGWRLSGITTFSSGIPVYMYQNDESSMLGTSFAGPLPLGVDTPDFSGGSVRTFDPRNSNHLYFDKSQFSAENPAGIPGVLGTARRRFFQGPGLNNFSMALSKNTKLFERCSLEFRAEFFNIFNHTQFSTVDGNFNSRTFGQAIHAQDPRIGQLALKLSF